MRFTSFVMTASLALTGGALAHETGTPHAHPHKPAVTTGSVPATGPNGGPVSVADGHPIEMVAGDKELVFYVQGEDQKPMDTAGTSGRAIVTQGGKNATVQLKAAAPNKLSGPLAAPLAAGAKVVFSAKLHGHNMQARFEKK